jgi:hypothetical protein
MLASSYTHDAASVVGTGGPWAMFLPLPLTSLTAGTKYRFLIEPTTANSQSMACYIEYQDVESQRANWGELIGVVTNDLSTFTEYTTRAYPIVPVIDLISPDYPDAANVWKSSGDTVNGAAGTMTAANITVTNGAAATLTAPDIKTGVIVDPGADHIDGSVAGGGGVIVIED